MANAYFLNGTQSQLLLVLNNGVKPPLAPFSVDNPTVDEAVVYDIVQATNPGASQFGARNRLQVSNPAGDINYAVSIVIDTNITPLTADLQFIVFADGVLGRQDISFNGITITQIQT